MFMSYIVTGSDTADAVVIIISNNSSISKTITNNNNISKNLFIIISLSSINSYNVCITKANAENCVAVVFSSSATAAAESETTP